MRCLTCIINASLFFIFSIISVGLIVKEFNIIVEQWVRTELLVIGGRVMMCVRCWCSSVWHDNTTTVPWLYRNFWNSTHVVFSSRASFLYYPVQRGYAQGDSQEYSKGFWFDRRPRIDKTQNSRLKMTNENLPDTIEANVSSTFVKFTSGSFEWT